jgi:hypothetical protein
MCTYEKEYDMKDLKVIHIDCECSSPECLHRYILFSWENERQIYMDLQSYRWESFFKRCIEAFKYVFGKGELKWVSVIPDKDKIPDLIEFLQNFNKKT